MSLVRAQALLTEGQAWLVVLLAATFATDTGAYATGRLFGRHKMAPSISPGKTWEGAVGGLIAGALAVIAATRVLDAPPSIPALAAIALALPAVSEVGDLVESAVKRRLGVKDMSQLLPGHGGLMDRLDSILPNVIAGWLSTERSVPLVRPCRGISEPLCVMPA